DRAVFLWGDCSTGMPRRKNAPTGGVGKRWLGTFVVVHGIRTCIRANSAAGLSCAHERVEGFGGRRRSAAPWRFVPRRAAELVAYRAHPLRSIRGEADARVRRQRAP